MESSALYFWDHQTQIQISVATLIAPLDTALVYLGYGIPIFQDGIGQFLKIPIPDFQNAGMGMEIPAEDQVLKFCTHTGLIS